MVQCVFIELLPLDEILHCHSRSILYNKKFLTRAFGGYLSPLVIALVSTMCYCNCKNVSVLPLLLLIHVLHNIISCFPVGYREISVKIFFNLTLITPVKIPTFMFLLPRLIARASQPDGNMTSFTLHFSRLM